MAYSKKVRELAKATGITNAQAKAVLDAIAPANADAKAKKSELRTYLGKAARNEMRAEVGAKAGTTMAAQTDAVKAKARKWLKAHGYDAQVVAKGLNF